jgi:hypothetical protein
MPSIINHTRRIRVDISVSSVGALVNDYHPDNTGVIVRPDGQRLLAQSWSLSTKKGRAKQANLIDSIFYGYAIPSILLNRRRALRIFEVYDGRHRLETMWNFHNDKLKWNNHLFSELSDDDQRVFMERSIPVTITDGATNVQLAELFIRVNAGVPLRDSDLLWANRDSALVRGARNVIENHPRLSAALGGLSLTSRSDLANWTAYVAGLSTQNAGNMTTSYVRLSSDEGLGLDHAVNEPLVAAGLDAYCTLLESANLQFPALVGEQRKYKKIGRVAAFFFADLMRAGNPDDAYTVHQKWLGIIGRLRGPVDDAAAMSAALRTTGAQNLTAAKVEQVLRQVNDFLAGIPVGVVNDDDDSDSDA